ncbi:MAG: chemotaxis protein CheW [Desulfobacteraceae bacterium]|nr:chemotaxis protein CheW [Desulfobacteraceae bacterium]
MTEAGRKYLIFTLSGHRYAFDLDRVAEVVEQPAICPIPLAPPCYPGAMNFHGTIVAVMDLACFLGLPGMHGAEKVIVLDTRIAALAFSVENIIRITPAGQSGIFTAGGATDFSLGQLDLAEGKAILLDAAAIAEHAARTIND